MKTEQEKYTDAMQKAMELKKAIDDMAKETKVRFAQDVVQATGMQQMVSELQKYLMSKR